jgi:hypothetical protein
MHELPSFGRKTTSGLCRDSQQGDTGMKAKGTRWLAVVGGLVIVLSATPASADGACCFYDSDCNLLCEIISEVLCDAIGGVYQGDGTDCDPNPCCLADFDYNRHVHTPDLLYLLGCWGTPCADLDCDGDTTADDLLILLGAWGPC